ncbi:MAG: hypothetical protein HOE19_04220 [Candidatus Komeilibacteria bacterium]|jgi:hypothetical protein|nr:hypothetical protein [Candidatus Komeilibacteria bacterium]MBT4447880.1 hypothetical protein [Candidatus Komeilibacteria bacterium]
MTITTFGLQNYTLLIAGIINLIMSILVFSRGIKHNKVNLYFSLLTFFNFLWAISLLLSKSFLFGLSAEISYRTAYVAALGISVFLFYFTLYFPYKNKNLKLYYQVFLIFLSIILSVLSYSKLHIIDFSGGFNSANWFVNYYKPFYLVYSVFFIYVIMSSIYFLIDKLKNIDNFLKNRIKILLITLLVGLLFGSYFNLVLPYFENWHYESVGPIFTAFMNAYVFYLIFNRKEK